MAAEPKAFVLLDGDGTMEVCRMRGQTRLRITKTTTDAWRFSNKAELGKDLAELMKITDFYPEATGFATSCLAHLGGTVQITDVAGLDNTIAIMLSIHTSDVDLQRLCRGANQAAANLVDRKKYGANFQVHGRALIVQKHGQKLPKNEYRHDYLPINMTAIRLLQSKNDKLALSIGLKAQMKLITAAAAQAEHAACAKAQGLPSTPQGRGPPAQWFKVNSAHKPTGVVRLTAYGKAEVITSGKFPIRLTLQPGDRERATAGKELAQRLEASDFDDFSGPNKTLAELNSFVSITDTALIDGQVTKDFTICMLSINTKDDHMRDMFGKPNDLATSKVDFKNKHEATWRVYGNCLMVKFRRVENTDKEYVIEYTPLTQEEINMVSPKGVKAGGDGSGLGSSQDDAWPKFVYTEPQRPSAEEAKAPEGAASVESLPPAAAPAPPAKKASPANAGTQKQSTPTTPATAAASAWSTDPGPAMSPVPTKAPPPNLNVIDLSSIQTLPAVLPKHPPKAFMQQERPESSASSAKEESKPADGDAPADPPVSPTHRLMPQEPKGPPPGPPLAKQLPVPANLKFSVSTTSEAPPPTKAPPPGMVSSASDATEDMAAAAPPVMLPPHSKPAPPPVSVPLEALYTLLPPQPKAAPAASSSAAAVAAKPPPPSVLAAAAAVSLSGPPAMKAPPPQLAFLPGDDFRSETATAPAQPQVFPASEVAPVVHKAGPPPAQKAPPPPAMADAAPACATKAPPAMLAPTLDRVDSTPVPPPKACPPCIMEGSSLAESTEVRPEAASSAVLSNGLPSRVPPGLPPPPEPQRTQPFARTAPPPQGVPAPPPPPACESSKVVQQQPQLYKAPPPGMDKQPMPPNAPSVDASSSRLEDAYEDIAERQSKSKLLEEQPPATAAGATPPAVVALPMPPSCEDSSKATEPEEAAALAATAPRFCREASPSKASSEHDGTTVSEATETARSSDSLVSPKSDIQQPEPDCEEDHQADGDLGSQCVNKSKSFSSEASTVTQVPEERGAAPLEDTEKFFVMGFAQDAEHFKSKLHRSPELEPLVYYAEEEGYSCKVKSTSIFVHPSQFEFVKKQVKKYQDDGLLKPHQIVVAETYSSLLKIAASRLRGLLVHFEELTFTGQTARSLREQ
eukprot:TRINITY_DN9540_c0_g1_i1.p1 TRINITY_DN9540_c0_g1~~TRINITY_DN9540_c0_g1_i1.p1  ORF type:complete len:1138 (+),score=189.45 TRINITY_DN9540_c0_g1_i1:83-3496(+)